MSAKWIFLSSYKNGVRLRIHLQPKASRNAMIGLYGDALKIALVAQPVDGKANAALLEFIRSLFSKSKAEVELISGLKSRNKTIFIQNISLDIVHRILATHIQS